MKKEKLLLVEDDVNFGFVLKSYLEMNNLEVELVSDGKDAIPAFEKDNYKLCILDVMLPNIDGFTIAKEIRKLSKKTPIIFLTAKALKEDILTGFKIGADDYLIKPFDSDVLLLKIKAIMRRNDGISPYVGNKVKIGKYMFDIKLRLLNYEGGYHKLTPREADLLKELFINRNSVLDRDEALRKIWGHDNYFNARSMDVYITRLRRFFKDDDKIRIRNVHGSGFTLEMKK